MNSSGGFISGSLARYEPYGGYRTKPATTVNPGISDHGFTGHRHNNTGTNNLGLIYMNARYYLPEVGRFISPDSIVPEPGNPQSYNRYAYTYNNPINNTDPSGHWLESALDVAFIAYDIYDIQQNGLNWVSGASLVADVAGLIIPVATGGGLAVRALAHGDDILKVAHIDTALKTAGDIGNASAAYIRGYSRFLSIAEEAVPQILKAVEGPILKGVTGLPSHLNGRRITTIGRLDDTSAASKQGARILEDEWSLAKNADWIQEAIANGDVFEIVSDVTEANLFNDFGISVYARELDALLQSGYTRNGNYLIPPQ